MLLQVHTINILKASRANLKLEVGLQAFQYVSPPRVTVYLHICYASSAADGRQTFQLDPPPDSAGKSTATRTRKRKTPPPQGGEEANTAPPPTGPGQQQFAYAAESPVQPPTSEQTQQGPGYPLDPSIQSFANDGGGATDREQEGRPSATPAASGNPRIVNPSKRAEQNRKAQRAFRERRDACVVCNALTRPFDSMRIIWQSCKGS